MVSVNAMPTSDAPLVTMKGAPERVLARCDKAMIDGKVVPIDDAIRQRVIAMQVRIDSKSQNSWHGEVLQSQTEIAHAQIQRAAQNQD